MSIVLSNAQKTESLNPFEGILEMEVTDEIVSKIADAKFAWKELFPQGHLIILVAKANGGKTTFMTHVAGEMVTNGYKVLYVNADAGASQIKEYYQHAKDNGYKLINFDLTNGSSETVINQLENMAIADYDFSDTVIILDTLKKFCDLMQKTSSKVFYTLLRTLTAKGMTVICLAHANKYDDKEGMPIYEGTGDTRNDSDELFYLIPVRNPDGTMTVSTNTTHTTAKSRAKLKDISFTITADRKVEILNKHIDTLVLSQYQRDLENDSEIVNFILDRIEFKSLSVTELHDFSKNNQLGYSRKDLETVLKRYSDMNSSCPEPKWLAMKAVKYGTLYGKIAPYYAKEIKNNWGV
ncbi:AAA family ATPase [Polynucleobacter kasalickyi]|uniref:AAA domain-containing protein n=1 Tax=Polynucleobacter kasalickyi TaxID=1938817 RepID=A0A1W2AGY4_9BURK|nr:AAA family ATPase [Polynucleobacter kasalickyi]SMC59752.1 AAA domain-containing protein [Polynucleobacter kasalickyi]